MNYNTFSIVAYDASEQSWGVAVASKFPAVGAVVPWAQAEIGAVATQAHVKVSFGREGLRLMSEGKSASDTLRLLLEEDDLRDNRQIGLVDAQGNVAAHTGSECYDWAGHKLGDGFCVQGNLLTGENVIDAMAEAYTIAQGELSDKLIAALQAGDLAGGDQRGKQSAAIHVVRTNAGYGNDTDRYLDLRVDDHEDPVARLMELVDMHHLYFQPPKPDDAIHIDTDIAKELQAMMVKHGYTTDAINGVWDNKAQQAFWVLIGNENLEMRWSIQGDTHSIDRVALDYLRGRLG